MLAREAEHAFFMGNFLRGYHVCHNKRPSGAFVLYAVDGRGVLSRFFGCALSEIAPLFNTSFRKATVLYLVWYSFISNLENELMVGAFEARLLVFGAGR